MFDQVRFLLLLVFLQTMKELASAAKVRFVPQNQEIFTPCPNQPINVLNINGLFDYSTVEFKMNDELNIDFKGNTSLIWDIKKSDKIQVQFEIFKFERGYWYPTMYRMTVSDTCRVLYDKNQFWYTIWTKHVLNSNEIKDNCLNVPGTTFVHEPFEITMIFDLPSGGLDGKMKILGTMKAFYGPRNIQRPTSICFEIIGDAEDL